VAVELEVARQWARVGEPQVGEEAVVQEAAEPVGCWVGVEVVPRFPADGDRGLGVSSRIPLRWLLQPLRPPNHRITEIGENSQCGLLMLARQAP